jgi:lipopolysaccharide transport system permease protein
MLLNQVRMDIRARYMGTTFGVLWTVLNPLLWTGIYSFVIIFVLRARLNTNSTPIDYVTFILCGLIPWLSFQESLIFAANSILSNSYVVKNLPFPLEIFPISGVLSSMLSFGVGLVLVFLGVLLSGRSIGWPMLFLPVAILIQIIFSLGWGFFLSSLSVFVRDTIQFISYILMALLYLTPVVYDISMVPLPVLKQISSFNPLYHMVQMYRDIFYNNRWPDPLGTVFLLLVSLVILALGYRFFRRTKAHFSDYLA